MGSTFLVQNILSMPTCMLGAAVVIATLVYFLALHFGTERPRKDLPVISLDEEGLNAEDSWNNHGLRTLAKGLREHPGKPFQIITGLGPKAILPTSFAKELQDHPDTNFARSLQDDWFGGWRGFEGVTIFWQHEKPFVDTIRVDITRSLGLLTAALVDETRAAVPTILGDEPEWKNALLKDKTGPLITRLASRVFLGQPLCRDEEWLNIAFNYAVEIAHASTTLRATSSIFRPILYWFNPHCTRLRKHARDARRLVAPEVQRRTARARKAMEAGQKPERLSDTIGWMATHSQDRNIDLAAGQLGMAFAGVHNTTEALSTLMIYVCTYPDIVQPLREEITTALTEHGWSREGIARMSLLDSFMKEASRLNPSLAASMGRYCLKDITLSSGLRLPKGSRFLIAGAFRDPAVYPEPDKFDAYRFLKLRETATAAGGSASDYLFTTMTPEHMGFGYGNHGCPGRFLVSNEMKIALSFMLLLYDWKLEDGPTFRTFAVATTVHPQCKISYRRRECGMEM